jgi:hypothetical protein
MCSAWYIEYLLLSVDTTETARGRVPLCRVDAHEYLRAWVFISIGAHQYWRASVLARISIGAQRIFIVWSAWTVPKVLPRSVTTHKGTHCAQVTSRVVLRMTRVG